MNDDKKKQLLIIGIVLGLVLLISSGTYAYLTWRTSATQETNVSFTVSSTFSCSADGGGNITEDEVDIAPTVCTNTGRVIKRKITTSVETEGNTIYLDMWLNINEIGSGFTNSQNLRYSLTETEDCTATPIASGNFYNKTVGKKIHLLDGSEYSVTGGKTYYLWIWLDAEETDSATQNQKLNLSLGGECGDVLPVEPTVELQDGMIPVVIADDGTVTTISENDENWYDYDNQKWANAVLVKSTYRSRYQGTSGVTITSSYILGYFVYIPRYKYQIWTTSTSSTGNEQEIQIKWENKDSAYLTESSVGSWITHPAFWWDEDNDGVVDDGEMQAGFWIGKFETTGSATTPTVLPNSDPLRNQTVSVQFTTALQFAGGSFDTSTGEVTFSGNSTYGTSSTTNAHMLKNSEWGAVAYLAHSRYGINSQVRINNYYSSSGYKTGCGSSTAPTSTSSNISSSCEIQYGNATSYPQSTTGNISGVFDMSGGAWEYVMSNLNDEIVSAGFTVFPESKYYDKYTEDIALTACSGRVCFGHALSETSGWYSNSAFMTLEGFSWTLRGGDRVGGTTAGLFRFGRHDGGAYNSQSFRMAMR